MHTIRLTEMPKEAETLRNIVANRTPVQKKLNNGKTEECRNPLTCNAITNHDGITIVS